MTTKENEAHAANQCVDSCGMGSGLDAKVARRQHLQRKRELQDQSEYVELMCGGFAEGRQDGA